jgi:hypothetical protein
MPTNQDTTSGLAYKAEHDAMANYDLLVQKDSKPLLPIVTSERC